MNKLFYLDHCFICKHNEIYIILRIDQIGKLVYFSRFSHYSVSLKFSVIDSKYLTLVLFEMRFLNKWNLFIWSLHYFVELKPQTVQKITSIKLEKPNGNKMVAFSAFYHMVNLFGWQWQTHMPCYINNFPPNDNSWPHFYDIILAVWCLPLDSQELT